MRADQARSVWSSRGDEPLRSLALIQRSGSTSRVLNLLAATDRAKAQGRDLCPKLFEATHLNRIIIVKHRLQGDERSIFVPARSQATKIIIPFVGRDLSLGGQTIFVGQRGWTSIINGADADSPAFQRDVALFKLLDDAPSLDPFLLREHLRRYGHKPDVAYFSITPSDVTAMEAYVAEQIAPLIRLAFKAQPHRAKAQIARFSLALLSENIYEALEPLRSALYLTEEDFGESIYCWKGILYYKWKQDELRDQLNRMLAEIESMSVIGPRPADQIAQASGAARRVRSMVGDLCRETDGILSSYDVAFQALIERGQPGPFHNFLKTAPHIFMVLGRKLGAAAHVTSYWRYRFPPSQPRSISLDEYVQILEEFQRDLDVMDDEQDESFLI